MPDRCPFCDCPEDMQVHGYGQGGRAIACIGCGAKGPTARTIALAWAAWRSRAQSEEQGR